MLFSHATATRQAPDVFFLFSVILGLVAQMLPTHFNFRAVLNFLLPFIITISRRFDEVRGAVATATWHSLIDGTSVGSEQKWGPFDIRANSVTYLPCCKLQWPVGVHDALLLRLQLKGVANSHGQSTLSTNEYANSIFLRPPFSLYDSLHFALICGSEYKPRKHHDAGTGSQRIVTARLARRRRGLRSEHAWQSRLV